MKDDYIAVLIVAFVLVVSVGAWGLTGFITGEPEAYGRYDSFAKCLTEKGLVLYTLQTCPNCKDQKALFGSSIKYLAEVDCSSDYQKCAEAGITNVPTWISADGAKFVGAKALETMSMISGCSLE